MITQERFKEGVIAQIAVPLNKNTPLLRAQALEDMLEHIQFNSTSIEGYDSSITPGLWWLQKRLMNVIDDLKEP